MDGDDFVRFEEKYHERLVKQFCLENDVRFNDVDVWTEGYWQFVIGEYPNFVYD